MNENITHKYDNGIIDTKALAERHLPAPPYPLKTIAGIHGFIMDWLLYEPPLILDDIDAVEPPDRSPEKWKYHHIENDYSLKPTRLVLGNPRDQKRAVANVSQKKGVVYAATYLLSEGEQDVFLELNHCYAYGVRVGDELVVDGLDALPKSSYTAEENILPVHLVPGANLLVWTIRLFWDHTFIGGHSLRLSGSDESKLAPVKIALSANNPEEPRGQELVFGKLPNEVEEVRHFVSNYYPRTSSYNYFNRLYSKPRLCEFSGNTPSELKGWQEKTRQKLVEILGASPEPCDLDPQTIMTSDEGSYTKELLELQVEEYLWMPVFLFTPKKLLKEGAAVVYVGGHGGIDDTNIEYILDCVSRGYIVLSVESRWYHRRSDPVEFDTSLLRGTFRVQKQDVHFAQHMCDLTARRAIAFGRNTMAMTVYDLMRSVDFLLQYRDTDKDRIGTSGISLAGSITPFFAAVDMRIKATVASCFVVNYRFTQLHQYECGSVVIPGLTEHMDNHEICSLIAPRYLLMERGVKNHRGIAENHVYRHVKSMYEKAGCPGNAMVDIFHGVHEYHGTKSLDWLDQCL